MNDLASKPLRRFKPRRWWGEDFWLPLVAAWSAALVLGTVGFSQYNDYPGSAYTLVDNFYLTLQLISLNSGGLIPPLPPALNFARFLIPALTLVTAATAFLNLFRRQVQLIGLRYFYNNHVIICGLSHKGYHLARGFRQRGEKVVVIEEDEDNAYLEECDEWGAIVFKGDASDIALLERARLNRARWLVAVTDNDSINAEIALRAYELTKERESEPLTCLLHIVDPRLYQLLRERELATDPSPAFRLELFNVFDRGATLAWEQTRPADYPVRAPRLVMVGVGRFGQSLIARAGRSWWLKHRGGAPRLHITLLDYQAEQKIAALLARYPRLAEACELAIIQLDVRGAEFQRAEFLLDEHGRCNADQVYVCFDNDSLGLEAALTLAHGNRCAHLPILVRMAEESGLAALVNSPDGRHGSFERLTAFGLLDQTCDPDSLEENTTHAILARAIYEQFQSPPPGDAASFVPWDQLSTFEREATYQRVDHLYRDLQNAGYMIVPLTDWEAAFLEFTPNQIDSLARQEYQRQYRAARPARRKAGDKQDFPPQAMPPSWEDLGETERDKICRLVGGLPYILARAGFQVAKLDE